MFIAEPIKQEKIRKEKISDSYFMAQGFRLRYSGPGTGQTVPGLRK